MIFPPCYEATITRADFVRLLPRACADASLHETASGFAGQGWAITLTPLPPLAIGIVRMERWRIEIHFDGLTLAEQNEFMRRYSQCYQRAGG